MLSPKLVVYIEPGTPLPEAAQELINLAKRLDVALIFQFGGEWITVTATDSPEDIIKQYDEMEKIKEHRTRKFPPRPVRKK